MFKRIFGIFGGKKDADKNHSQAHKTSSISAASFGGVRHEPQTSSLDFSGIIAVFRDAAVRRATDHNRCAGEFHESNDRWLLRP